MKKKLFLLVAITLLSIVNLFAQCAQTVNIYSFTYGGHNYEVVKELKSWATAAACAVERGGYLVQIDSSAENTQIMAAITSAGIAANYHPVADGGGASYIWTGGTDRNIESLWLWDGDINNVGSNFWIGQGTAGTGNGYAVNSAYINWGNINGSEPDNYLYNGSDQDGLGIALGTWPHGVAGKWNDLAINNTLYYIIEKNGIIPTPCATPSLLNSFNITTTSAKICWSSSAPNFSIKYKKSTATSWITIASANDTLDLTSLSMNTTYNFQVKAICSTTSSDTSAWSSVTNFTTLNNIGIQENDGNKINIYPNPASDFIQINRLTGSPQELEISFFTIDGRLIYNQTKTIIETIQIDISTIPAGIYFARVKIGNNNYLNRFIKQ